MTTLDSYLECGKRLSSKDTGELDEVESWGSSMKALLVG